MATLTQLLAERDALAPPSGGGGVSTGVTLNDLLEQKRQLDSGVDLSQVQQQQAPPGPISQAAGVAGNILNLEGIGKAIAQPFQTSAQHFAPQPQIPPAGEQEGIVEQLFTTLQNAPKATREFNRLVTPGTDVSEFGGDFPGAGLARGALEFSQKPVLGILPRAIGRAGTGFTDALSTIGGAGVSGFHEGESGGLPKQVAESKLLDPNQPEAFNEFARNPLATTGRGLIRGAGFGAQAIAPIFGAADPNFVQAKRDRQAGIEGPLPKPDIGASIKQGFTKDFPEFIRKSLVRFQKKHPDIGAENMKRAEAFLPALTAELDRQGKSPEEKQREIERQLFNVGFGGNVGELAGEIAAFEIGITPLKAVTKGVKAFGAARRATKAAKGDALLATAAKTEKQVAGMTTELGKLTERHGKVASGRSLSTVVENQLGKAEKLLQKGKVDQARQLMRDIDDGIRRLEGKPVKIRKKASVSGGTTEKAAGTTAPVTKESEGISIFSNKSGSRSKTKIAKPKGAAVEEAVVKTTEEAAESVAKATTKGNVIQQSAAKAAKGVKEGDVIKVGKGKTAAVTKKGPATDTTNVERKLSTNVLKDRSTNIGKRLKIAGGDKTTEGLLKKATNALEAGENSAAESLLKQASDNTKALEGGATSLKQSKAPKKKAVTKKVEEEPVVNVIQASAKKGVLRTGDIRARIEKLRTQGASPTQLDAATAALKDSPVKADALVSKAEAGLTKKTPFKAEPEAPISKATGRPMTAAEKKAGLAKNKKARAAEKKASAENQSDDTRFVAAKKKAVQDVIDARPKAKKTTKPKKKTTKKVDKASTDLKKKVKAAKKKGLGNKGQLRFSGKGEQKGVDPKSTAARIYSADLANAAKRKGSPDVQSIGKAKKDTAIIFDDGTYLEIREGTHQSFVGEVGATDNATIIRKGISVRSKKFGLQSRDTGAERVPFYEISSTPSVKTKKILKADIEDSIIEGTNSFKLELNHGGPMHQANAGFTEFTAEEFLDIGLEGLIKQARRTEGQHFMGALKPPRRVDDFLGNRGQAKLPEGQTPKGKAILAKLADLSKQKKSRPTFLGKSPQIEENLTRNLQQLKLNIEESGLSAAKYIRGEGGTANDVNRLIPQLKATADLQSFAKRRIGSAKSFLQGTRKGRKIDPSEFGEKIVADFVDKELIAAQRKGLKATTAIMRKRAVADLVAARGLGTGGETGLQSALRKIKAGDSIIDKAITGKGDLPDALMQARRLYGSALNEVQLAAKIRSPLPKPFKGHAAVKQLTKAEKLAQREGQIAQVKAADINKKAVQAEFDTELKRLNRRLKEVKGDEAVAKIQAKIDTLKERHPVNLAKAGGENVVGGPQRARIGRLKVKPAVRKTKGAGLEIFRKKPLPAERALAKFRTAEKPAPSKGVIVKPKESVFGPVKPFKAGAGRPSAKPFSKGTAGKIERQKAMFERRVAGKKFIKDRVDDIEGLKGRGVEELLREPANTKQLRFIKKRLKKAKKGGDTAEIVAIKGEERALRGKLQAQVKKQARSAQIRLLTKKMSDAFRRGNMQQYKNVSEDLEKILIKPSQRAAYLKAAEIEYEAGFANKSFKVLADDIYSGKLLGNKGFARLGSGKKFKSVDAKAVVSAAEKALFEQAKTLAGKAEAAGKPLKKWLMESQQYSSKEAGQIAASVNRALKKSDDLARIGSINVKKLVRQGNLSKKDAKFAEDINEYGKATGDFLKKEKITKADRARYLGNEAVQRVINDMLRLNDAQIAVIPDEMFAQMQSAIARMVSAGVKPSDAILGIRPMIQGLSRLETGFARGLQSLADPNNAAELMRTLRKSLLKATTREDVIKIQATIDMLKPYSPSQKLQAWRAYQEFSVNNVLSAGVTQTRNIFGAGLEVFVRQPTDRITRAMLTTLTGGRIKNPAYWSEILPEITAIYGNVGKGILTGARFFKYGSSKKLVTSTMERIGTIRGELLKVPKNSRKFHSLINQRDKLWQQVKDVVEINANARTGEVFTGQSSTLRTLARQIENPVLRESADFAAKIVNIPVRALVASDAAITQMSFAGHKAAMQVRQAIKTGKTLAQVRAGKFNLLQKNIALEDSLYYLYRRDWGKLAKAIGIEKLLRVPVIDNLFLFLRTRTNILKNYIDNSPFGFINVINESMKVKGLDAKSMARFVNGTALHIGLYHWAKSKGGKFVGPSKDKKERLNRQTLKIPELYFQDKDGNTHDMSNIAPVSPLIALVAAYMDAEARGKIGGQTMPDNLSRAWDQVRRSFIEDAIYSDFKTIQRMADRFAETSDDPTAYGSQALYRDLAKFATGRGLPNILRETKKSGKILGIPIGLEPDMSVVEATGNFAQTLEQQIASDIPGFTPPILRISPLTGRPVTRSKKFTPFNPKFWTEGITPGTGIPENEKRVVTELQRVKAGYTGPKGTVAKKYISVKLNQEEKNHMTRVLSGAKWKGLNLLETLDSIVTSPGYQSMTNIAGGAIFQRDTLQGTIGTFTEIGYLEAVKLAVKRLMKTDAGRRRLWFNAYQGNPDFPYTDNVEDLKFLLRINNVPIE